MNYSGEIFALNPLLDASETTFLQVSYYLTQNSPVFPFGQEENLTAKKEIERWSLLG